MFMPTIASIYHRHPGIVRNHLGRPLPGMPDDNDIGITSHNPGHVPNAFTLGQGSCTYINSRYDTTSESKHSSLKGQAGSGTWFEEEACHDLPLTHAGLPGHGFRHLVHPRKTPLAL